MKDFLKINHQVIFYSCLVTLTVVFVFINLPNMANANTGFLYASGKNPNYIPSGFQLNSPLPLSIKKYLPNQKIIFQMDFWANGSGTSLRDVSLRITKPISELENPETYWGEWKNVGTLGRFNGYTNSNLPWTESPEPIVTPNKPGIYRVYFEIKNNISWTIGKTFSNNYIGFVDIEVVNLER